MIVQIDHLPERSWSSLKANLVELKINIIFLLSCFSPSAPDVRSSCFSPSAPDVRSEIRHMIVIDRPAGVSPSSLM
jgi:hypothetical protein